MQTPLAVTVGVDIGGSKILAVTIDSCDGSELSRGTVETPSARGGDAVVRAALALAGDVVNEASRPSVSSVGVAATGAIRDGVIRASGAHMVDWLGVDLGSAFRRQFFAPTYVANDVHVLATDLIESTEADAGLLVTVGTGIGGAFYSRGKVLPGRLGTRGSIGHLLAAWGPTARICTCGGLGHLEAHASGPALLSIFRDGGGTAHSLADVARQATAGSGWASAVLGEGAQLLGAALAGLVVACDLEEVRIAGGVLGTGSTYQNPLRDALLNSQFPPDRALRILLIGDVGATALAAARWALRDSGRTASVRRIPRRGV